MMLRSGEVDAMVAGATCPTARVIEAALMTLGLATDVDTPSSSFLISLAGADSRSIATCCSPTAR